MISLRGAIRPIELFLVHKVLRANDSPHRLALGVAIGMFVGWTPTIGVQMALAFLLALALRANARVAVPVVWVSNPLTIVPIYLPNYWLGRKLLGLLGFPSTFSYDRSVTHLLETFYSPKLAVTKLFEASFWRELARTLLAISGDLWLGSVIIGLLVATVSYIIVYKFITWYRTNHPSARRFVARLLRRHREHP